MEADAMLGAKKKLAGLIPNLVDFERDLPDMVFKGFDWTFRFFERPILLNDEVMGNVIESSFMTFGSGMFLKFSRSFELDSIMVIDSPCAGPEFNLLADAYDENIMTFGYPVVFGDQEGRWVGFEGAREELGVIAVRKSKQGEEFISRLGEGLLSAPNLKDRVQEESDWGAVVKAFTDIYGT